MKKSLLLFIVLVCAAVSEAQVLFQENFDNIPGPTAGGIGTYVFPSGWLLANVDNLTPDPHVSNVNQAWERREDSKFNILDSAAFSTSWYSPVGRADDWMWTPPISLGVPGTPNLRLSWNAVAYDSLYPDGYEVRIMTGVAPIGGTGVLGNMVNNSKVLFSTPGRENPVWTRRTVDLTAYSGQTVYIGFRNNSYDNFLLLIDDIIVENICEPPADLNVTDIMANTAILHWSSATDNFKVRYRVSGTASWTTKPTSTGTSRGLENLAANTKYEWQVRSFCDADTSGWVKGPRFTTPSIKICKAPAGLNVTDIMANTAILHWSPAADNFKVRYRVLTTASWLDMPISTGTSRVLENLAANTKYEWQVRSICDPDTSNWVQGPGFTTGSGTQVFLEDFDNISGSISGGAGTYTFPSGWTLANVDNRKPADDVAFVKEAWARYPEVPDTVACSTSWYDPYDPAGQADDWMWTPPITLGGSNLHLSWDALAPDLYFRDGYEVRIMTVKPTGGTGVMGNMLSNSTVLFSITEENNSWTSRVVDLNAYSGQTVYIGFRNNSYNKKFLLIDNIKVAYSCEPPAGLNVTNIRANRATVNWHTATTTENFRVRYRVAGTTSWKMKSMSTATSRILQNLAANTAYQWQVSSFCDADASGWVAGPRFTTASPGADVSNGISTMKENIQVMAMPNPSNGNFIVQMQLPQKKDQTTITLYNGSGEKIWQQDIGAVNGMISQNVYLQNKLSPGVYLLKIKRPDFNTAIKIVVIK